VLTVLLALRQKQLTDQELFNLKMKLARNLLNRKIPSGKIRSLLTFLRLYVRFADSENNNKFEEDIDTIIENKKTMGIEEFVLDRAEKQGFAKGLKEGLKSHEEAKFSFVKNLLLDSDFSQAKIASLAGVTISFVRKVKRSLTASVTS
jgi:hypothetical protein